MAFYGQGMKQTNKQTESPRSYITNIEFVECGCVSKQENVRQHSQPCWYSRPCYTTMKYENSCIEFLNNLYSTVSNATSIVDK